jgi:hypothetical protein
VGIRILALTFIAGSLAMAAGTPSRPEPLRTPESLFDLTWAVADFDGDLQPDIASARLAHHDGRGFALEVIVNLGPGGTSFHVRSSVADVELSARDIDGDKDRDIIVLEARTKQPVGVWLNDGAGSFEEADVARFRKSIGDSSGPRLRALSSPFVLHAMVEQHVPASLPALDFANRDRKLELLVFPSDSPARHISASGLRTRAPPRS